MKQLIYTADALSGCTLQHGHNQRIQLITYMINKRLTASCGWLFKIGYLNVHTTYIHHTLLTVKIRDLC